MRTRCPFFGAGLGISFATHSSWLDSINEGVNMRGWKPSCTVFVCLFGVINAFPVAALACHGPYDVPGEVKKHTLPGVDYPVYFCVVPDGSVGAECTGQEQIVRFGATYDIPNKTCFTTYACCSNPSVKIEDPVLK